MANARDLVRSEQLWRDHPYEADVGAVVAHGRMRYRVIAVSGFGYLLFGRPLPWWQQPAFWRGFRKGAGHPLLVAATAATLLWLLWRWP
jgi:hypothetical protein